MHCHLQDTRLKPLLDDVFERALRAGVKGFLNCSTEQNDWEDVLDIALTRLNVIPAFGVHPWYLGNLADDWEMVLESYLNRVPSLVGEIGLDREKDPGNLDMQEEIFIKQLEIAVKQGLPVNIHCRKAWDRLLHLAKPYRKKLAGMIIHSYSGTIDLIKPLLELNAYFSFSLSLTRPRNTRVQKTVCAVPIDRLVFETDSPDIPPYKDGKVDYKVPNEPANILLGLQKAADMRGVPVEELAEQAWSNSIRLLKPYLPKQELSK